MTEKVKCSHCYIWKRCHSKEFIRNNPDNEVYCDSFIREKELSGDKMNETLVQLFCEHSFINESNEKWSKYRCKYCGIVFKSQKFEYEELE